MNKSHGGMVKGRVGGIFAACWLAAVGVVSAADLSWNGGSGGNWQDGSGGWLSGAIPVSWNNAALDNAVFGGVAPLVVSVDAGGISANGVAFAFDGYSVSGAGVLTLDSGVVDVGSGFSTLIAAALSGPNGLVKNGDGDLVLTNANKAYAGPTVINAGSIQVHGTGGGILGSTATQAVHLAGGRLQAQFSSNTTFSNAIEVAVSGGELRNLGTDSQRWIINGNRISGAGALTLSFGTNNTRYQIVTGQNDFSGRWILDGGGSQNRFIDVFASSAFGNASGADAITLTNSGSLALRNGVTLGNTNQGVRLVGPGQVKITAVGGSTAVVAAAISGTSSHAVQFLAENATSLLVLSNAANSWLGETSITGPGVVRLGLPGVVPDAGGNVIVGSTGIMDLNGNDEAIGGLFGSGRVDNRAAGTTPTFAVGANNNSPTFSGTIGASGIGAGINLVKTGAGIQTLSGTNSINGFVTVEAGTLALSGTADFTASSTVTINAGASMLVIGRMDGTLHVPPGQLLAGDGAVIGIISNRGVVAPGAPVGSLIHTGNYVQAASGTLRIAIAGSSSFSSLRSRGASTLDGTLDVNLQSYNPVAGDAFVVFEAASISGGFAATNLPALSAGLGWVVVNSTTSVLLSVTGAPPLSGYASWASEITNGQTNYDDFATADGYPNLLKYATGSSPTNSDLVASLGGSVAGGVLSLSFYRNTNATDVTVIVEGSSSVDDNGIWSGIATNVAGAWSPPVAVETGTSSPVLVTVPDVVSGTNRLMRLRVTIP